MWYNSGRFGGNIKAVKIITLLVLAATLQCVAFAQKASDPELRDKNAVSLDPHKSHSGVVSPVRTSSSSAARNLAQIERSGMQKAKTTQKTTPKMTAAPATKGTQAQGKNKSVKFSYHRPPQAGQKTTAKAAPVGSNSPGKVRR
jgi:hypothetical protein